MSLPRATFEIPFDGGLLTRGDERVKPPGAAENLLNAEFDDTGGLRVRFPFGTITNAIFGGGTLANCRRFALRDDELLVFTDTALYSWDPSRSKWINRGTHLAIAVNEATKSATNGDQLTPDRAELNGTVVYAWDENGMVYMAAENKISGAVIAPKTALGTTETFTRPRLIALSTKIMLLASEDDVSSPNIVALVIDPADPVASFANPYTSISGGNAHNMFYDVARIGTQDKVILAQRLTPTTSYRITTCDVLFNITTAVKARACDGPIAVSVAPDGLHVQVVRANGTNIQGDYITIAGLVDGAVNQAIGTAPAPGVLPTSVYRIAAAHRSVQNGGQYRCYVFWGCLELGDVGDPANDTVTKYNWVDTGGSLGAEAMFLGHCSVASRAFDRGGSIYLWMVFDGASTPGRLQGSYMLYRDDGLMAAVSRIGNASYQTRRLFGGALVEASGWLPGVQLTDGANTYRWMGVFARVFDKTVEGFKTARAPREIAFTFDSNTARRFAQMGRTLYISGSPVMQYDGNQLTELGFITAPWEGWFTTTAAAGSLSAGLYTWKATLRWLNAQGELERSTSMLFVSSTVAANDRADFKNASIWNTRKSNVTYEMWRSKVATSEPLFLVSSQDPAVAGNNAYIANSKTSLSEPAFSDAASDVSIGTHEGYPQTVGVRPSLPPPPGTIIAATESRLLLAGISDRPNTVYYSKYYQQGRVATFSDALFFETPSDSGPITALGYIDGTLVVWCETATYVFAGAGFDDTGGGSNFTLARAISTEVGAVSQDAVNFCDEGWYVKTQRGWYLLDRGLNYSYMGAGVYRYDSESVLAVVNLKTRHQNRIVTPSRVLVFDSLVKKWAEWTIGDALDMILDSSGNCWYLTSTGPRKEIADWTGYAGTDTSLTLCEVETTWLKPDGRQQGRYVVDYVQVLGEFRSSFKMRVQLAKDYEQTAPSTPSWHTDKTWTPFPTTNGSGLELRAAPKKKRCAAIKARITITATDGVSPLGGPCLRLDSLTGQYAVEPGIYGAVAAAQKQ